MKKQNLWGLILVGLMCVVLTACGDDNENTPVSNPQDTPKKEVSAVVGNWTRTYRSNGTVTVHFNLKDDGTFTEENIYVDNEGKTYNSNDYGDYTYNSVSHVLTTISKSGQRSWTYYVTDVQEHSMTLVFSDYSGSITFTK